MSNKSKRLKAMQRAQRELKEHNERVLARESERKAHVKPHEIRLSKQNRASVASSRYQNQRLGKLGAASKGKVIVKDGQLV